MDIAIDLGTTSTKVFVPDKGVIWEAPTCVAAERDTDKIIKIGREAELLLGRAPGNLRIERPLKNGVIADYDRTLALLRYCIRKANNNSFFKPNVLLSVPSTITEVEERALCDAALQAGAKRVYLMEETVASAIGVGLDISKAAGHMVVDIGGGCADIATVSCGDAVVSETVPVGGDTIDQAIIKYIRRKYNLVIGIQNAEEIRLKIGSACQTEQIYSADVRGRCSIEGIPKQISVVSTEIVDLMKYEVGRITDAICLVLERTPPELVTDIAQNGIVLTGGFAKTVGIDRAVSNATGIHTFVAENPSHAAVNGIGHSLPNLPAMQDGVINIARKNAERY